MKDPGGINSQPPKRPVEHVQRQDQLCHGVHRDARRENGHDGEADRVQAARLFIKAHAQVLGHRARLRAVIERHHEKPHENHRRNRADPIEVACRDSVLGAGSGHADHFLRAQICRNKSESAHPGGNRAACEEEVGAGAHRALQRHADSQHKHEVDQEDCPINPGHIARQPPFATRNCVPRDYSSGLAAASTHWMRYQDMKRLVELAGKFEWMR